MAIVIKTPEQVALMREACRRLGTVMSAMKEKVAPGVNLLELDELAGKLIEDMGDEILFRGYQGFPGNICLSLNDVVVHGVAYDYELKEGDVISVDMGLRHKGWCSDMARTFPVGKVSDEVAQLLADTEESFNKGISVIKAGAHVGDIGAAIEDFIGETGKGYGIVHCLAGHGIGENLHEEPQILNFGEAGTGPELKAGMVIAVEPMINLGTPEVEFDDWFVYTEDGKVSAHHENTLLVTEDGYEILTKMA